MKTYVKWCCSQRLILGGEEGQYKTYIKTTHHAPNKNILKNREFQLMGKRRNTPLSRSAETVSSTLTGNKANTLFIKG